MKISTKIALSNIILGTTCVFSVLAAVWIHNRKLQAEAGALAGSAAQEEAAQVARLLHQTCVAHENRNQQRLEHGLGVARAQLQEAGELTLGTEPIRWNAVHQVTREARDVDLPPILLGGQAVPVVTAADTPVPVVDSTTRLTREFCTVFQRMNEDGDMLRVATSVLKDDGTRAVGTYIPARQPDGTENPVVKAVLEGRTYRGRAWVVNQWHVAAYEPIWDATRTRVIGMLYVGISQADLDREMRDQIVQVQLGKSGQVSVYGTQGSRRGAWVISPGGKRDGESRLEAKDSEGTAYVQAILEAAARSTSGAVELVHYAPTDAKDPVPGRRVGGVAYFAPWDWTICAEAREVEFADVVARIRKAQRDQILTALVVVAVVGTFGFFASLFLGRSIARPIAHAISTLGTSTEQIILAAEHLTVSSNSLAECANDHAASSEETSASLKELTSTTRRNAESAGRANDIARTARQVTDQSAADVAQLKSAMSDIQASGQQISKIIQTIDEIAFQTNILALNAAVEAARAGAAGMGFGVVADEVRNLAQRSAEAARETSVRIEAAIAGTTRGVTVSEKVAHSLEAIHTSIHDVDSLVSEVAAASQEQKESVSQIDSAVGQMDQLTQRTAHGAEASATASEELHAQASMLRDELHRLAELVHSRAKVASRIPVPPPPAHALPKAANGAMTALRTVHGAPAGAGQGRQPSRTRETVAA